MRNGLRVLLVALVAAWALPVHAQWTWTPQTGRWVNMKRLPKETAELQIEHARSLMLQGDHRKAIEFYLREQGL